MQTTSPIQDILIDFYKRVSGEDRPMIDMDLLEKAEQDILEEAQKDLSDLTEEMMSNILIRNMQNVKLGLVANFEKGSEKK